MLKRWIVYFNDRIIQKFFGSYLICLSILLMVQLFLGNDELIISFKHFLPSATTYFLFLCHWNLADEFKDADTDRRFFPDRLVPSGKVLLSDLKILFLIDNALLIILNVLWLELTITFVICFLWAIFMAKWFFAEKTLKNNRLLAFLTHAPLVIVMNLYIIEIYCSVLVQPLLTWKNIFIAVWFALPYFVYEFARKTWAPSEEIEGYQTYSKMFGYAKSGTISYSFTIIQFMMLLIVRSQLSISVVYVCIYTVAVIAYTAALIMFVLRPENNSKLFIKMADMYLIVNVGLALDFILSNKVEWLSL